MYALMIIAAINTIFVKLELVVFVKLPVGRNSIVAIEPNPWNGSTEQSMRCMLFPSITANAPLKYLFPAPITLLRHSRILLCVLELLKKYVIFAS